MKDWTPEQWSQFLQAIATCIGAILASVVVVLQTMTKRQANRIEEKTNEQSKVLETHSEVLDTQTAKLQKIETTVEKK